MNRLFVSVFAGALYLDVNYLLLHIEFQHLRYQDTLSAFDNKETKGNFPTAQYKPPRYS
jgi:hypothetical protein